MPNFSAAQRRAYAIAMSKKRSVAASRRRRYISGPGAYSMRSSKPRVTDRRRRVVRDATLPVAVRGRGSYDTTMGGKIGQAIGGALGFGAQQLIKHIVGFGDYQITTNSLMGGLYDPPELKNLRDRSVVVRHREYITDIIASSSFTLQSYFINPGLVSSFPWLSQVAEAFEEYYITGMVYEYKTLSADYTTASSAALGYVIMATQYNVLNPNFPDKITMENYEFANSGKPSETFIHPIECKKSVNPVSELYVRTGAIPSGSDQRLYDLGNFQIATGGNSGSGVLGELWVTFEVVFCKPKLVAEIGYELLSDHYTLPYASIAYNYPYGYGNPSTVTIYPNTGSNLGSSISTVNKVNLPNYLKDQKLMYIYSVTGTSTSSVLGPTFSFVDCTVLNYWANDTSGSAQCGGTVSTFIQCVTFQVNNTSTATPQIVLNTTSAVYPTSITSADLWILQFNGGIAS